MAKIGAHPSVGARGDLLALGRQLGSAIQPDAIAELMASAVARALKASSASVWIRRLEDDEFELSSLYSADGSEIVGPESDPAAAPDGEDHAPDRIILPLEFDGDPVGQLVVVRGLGRPRFGLQEIELARQFAEQAGPSMQIVRLTHDLRRARERLVLAREEERRRLRRELHNTIGPTLAGLDLKTGALRAKLADDREIAAQMTELRLHIRAVISDIRRVIYNLRPPALDELGLDSAIRERATQFSQSGLAVSVELPEPMPVLPAAVEVAAYRIVLEALSNVARHSQATRAVVRLRPWATRLEIEVIDNGVGLPPAHQYGVGMSTMRELAGELGGGVAADSPLEGGTRVRVRLPIAPAPLTGPRDGEAHA